MTFHGRGDMQKPNPNYYNRGMRITPEQNLSLIEQGTDPKPLMLDYCKPQCVYWK